MENNQVMTVRPLKENVKTFCRLRIWCYEHNISFSDLFNAILEPLLFHLIHTAVQIPGTRMINFNLNPGTITIHPTRQRNHTTKEEREYFEVMGRRLTELEAKGHKLPDELGDLL